MMRMLPLAEITSDGGGSYPSIVPYVLVIGAFVLAVVAGSRRVASGPKVARVIYWSILVGAVVVCACLMFSAG